MSAPEPLRCAGCGVEGTEPRIIWDKSKPAPPVLTPVFGWGDEGRAALLCPSCKRGWRKPRRRRKAAPPGGLPL
jgi:hypothetical protein